VAVKIYSKILDAELWIVADGRDMEALQREQITDAIYTASELKELKGNAPKHIRSIHNVKREFPGSEVVDDV
jgi:hypothetical protein